MSSGVAPVFFDQMFARLSALPVVQVAMRSGDAFLFTQDRADLCADSERILHHVRDISVVVGVILAVGGRGALLFLQRVAVLNASGRVLVAVGSGTALVGIHVAATFHANTAHGSARTHVHSLNPALSQATDIQMRVAMLRSNAACFREAVAVLNAIRAM
jgi:hypothetical protein